MNYVFFKRKKTMWEKHISSHPTHWSSTISYNFRIWWAYKQQGYSEGHKCSPQFKFCWDVRQAQQGIRNIWRCETSSAVIRGIQSNKTCPAVLHCYKSDTNFRVITWNVEENEMLHEIVRVVSRIPPNISCYIAENLLSLGQCTAHSKNYRTSISVNLAIQR